MTAVRKLREQINESPDRWESAATSLETYINSSQSAITKRLESQKQAVVRVADKLKQILEKVREMPPDTRKKVINEVDQLRDELGKGKVNDRQSAMSQKQKIEKVKQVLEKHLESIDENVHPDFEQTVRNYIRAQMELETGLELAAQRFAYEQAENRAEFESRKQEMLKNIEQFRNMLNERRAAGGKQGKPFASEMNAAFEQIRERFQHLGDQPGGGRKRA